MRFPMKLDSRTAQMERGGLGNDDDSVGDHFSTSKNKNNKNNVAIELSDVRGGESDALLGDNNHNVTSRLGTDLSSPTTG